MVCLTRWTNHIRACLVLLPVLLLSACAEVPTDPDERAEFLEVNDPLEPMNRQIFVGNQRVDRYVLKPVTSAYQQTMPQSGQLAVHNVVVNWKTPWVFSNDVLQGQPALATQSLVRFMFNSTIGLGGLFDVVDATGGPKAHEADFGQTLGVWGVGEGPFLMLPFFGPSNPRDAFGVGVEFFADPTDLALSRIDHPVWSYYRVGTEVLDERAGLLSSLDDLERNSLDYYATIRSVYRQHRASLIQHRSALLTGAGPNKP